MDAEHADKPMLNTLSGRVIGCTVAVLVLEDAKPAFFFAPPEFPRAREFLRWLRLPEDYAIVSLPRAGLMSQAPPTVRQPTTTGTNASQRPAVTSAAAPAQLIDESASA